MIKCYVKVNINYQRRLESFVAERLSNIFYNYKFKNKYGIKVVIYLKKHSTIKEILNQKKVERKKVSDFFHSLHKKNKNEKEYSASIEMITKNETLTEKNINDNKI